MVTLYGEWEICPKCGGELVTTPQKYIICPECGFKAKQMEDD